MTDQIVFCEGLEHVSHAAVCELYQCLGWTSYTDDPESLQKALRNSTYIVTCVFRERLIGLARSLSDDVSIHYLQDILVLPEFQRQGIGSTLLHKCLNRFQNVRTHLLLTDDREQQKRFYQTCGYTNVQETVGLNVFLKMSSLENQG